MESLVPIAHRPSLVARRSYYSASCRCCPPSGHALCWMDIHSLICLRHGQLANVTQRAAWGAGGAIVWSAIKRTCKSPAAMPDMAPGDSTCCYCCSFCCCCCNSAKLLNGRVIDQRSAVASNMVRQQDDDAAGPHVASCATMSTSMLMSWPWLG